MNQKYKMVVFGHTHNPMLEVYPPGKNYTGIYANTGSWVNADINSKPVRNFLVIRPGKWTGDPILMWFHCTSTTWIAEAVCQTRISPPH